MSTVAIRFQGGLGDHILGMRLLTYVKRRYPAHRILAYSDSCGAANSLDVLKLSPFIDEIIPLYREQPILPGYAWGNLTGLDQAAVEAMRSAPVFLAGDLTQYFIPEARIVGGISHYEILASRPALWPSAGARRAARALAPASVGNCVAINFGKYGAPFLQRHRDAIEQFLMRILDLGDVTILNLFTRTADYPHWPEPQRTERREQSREEAEAMAAFCQWDDRIVPIVEQPVDVLAALLERCRYFIGVDNGIKHLAWALGVPHSVVTPRRLDWREPLDANTLRFLLLFMPDCERALTLEEPAEIDAHIADIAATLGDGRSGAAAARRGAAASGYAAAAGA
jgi:hypothetical protein